MSDKAQKGTEEGIVREKGRQRGRGMEERKREEGKKKAKQQQQHPYHTVLKPGPSLFLSVHDKFKLSLLSSFLHIFSSPYLLSQHCITCHFRIMSPHVYNDIAFVLRITSGFFFPAPYPPAITHRCWNKDTHTNRCTHTVAEINMQVLRKNIERDELN